MPKREVIALEEPHYTRDQQLFLKLVKEAARRLTSAQTFEDWLMMARAHEMIVQMTLRDLNLDEWDQHNWHLVRAVNARFEALWRGITNALPPTKQTRWAMRQLIVNPEIVAFYHSMPWETQNKLNHPTTVVNRYNSFKQDKTGAKRRGLYISLGDAREIYIGFLKNLTTEDRRDALRPVIDEFAADAEVLLRKELPR